jgi:hypothetical protein
MAQDHRVCTKLTLLHRKASKMAKPAISRLNLQRLASPSSRDSHGKNLIVAGVEADHTHDYAKAQCADLYINSVFSDARTPAPEARLVPGGDGTLPVGRI